MADPASAPDNAMMIDNSKNERSKLRYKSYRKKYRKMKIEFDQRMAKANELFKEEHRLLEIAHRIQEQNDQLLDLLLDINENLQVPRKYSMASLTKDLPSFTSSTSDGISLQELESKATHTSAKLAAETDIPLDLQGLDGQPPPGYLTTQYEEDFLAVIDSSLSAIPSTSNLPPGVEIIQPTARRREKSHVTERDFAIQNSVSVRNWLRKNEPQMFVDMKNNGAESASVAPVGPGVSPPSSKQKKRGPKSKKDDNFDEDEDDLTFDPSYDGEPKMRGRRKKDDDAYRPKGGSNRTTKRKREKSDADVKGGKKARTSGPSFGEDGL